MAAKILVLSNVLCCYRPVPRNIKKYATEEWRLLGCYAVWLL
jgi:hypothetical protein